MATYIVFRHFQWLDKKLMILPTICIVGYKYNVGFTD